MREKPDPYDGTMIFKPIPTIRSVIAKVEAARANKADRLAQLYAGPEVYQRYFKEAIQRLSASDIISVAEAAARMKVTPPAYEALANKGEALLITIGQRKFVPAWTITQDGTVDPMRLDIAREFVLEGNGYFKFIDYLRFMTEDKAEISQNFKPETLSALFNAAGLGAFDCSLSVKATMNQLADLRDKEPFYRETLLHYLDAAVTHGGWDASGGLSRPFRDRHNVPGPTMDEERMAPRP